jgi:hypothetical protein
MSQPVAVKKPAMAQLLNTRKAAKILGRCCSNFAFNVQLDTPSAVLFCRTSPVAPDMVYRNTRCASATATPSRPPPIEQPASAFLRTSSPIDSHNDAWGSLNFASGSLPLTPDCWSGGGETVSDLRSQGLCSHALLVAGVSGS